MPKVSAAHRAERRSQILAGARRAFSEHGYYGANVARLEAEIGLSRGAIFSYFPSKLDLFTALAAEDRNRVGQLWLDEGYDAVVRHVAEDPEWIGVYLEVGRLLRTDPDLRERWSDLSGGVQDTIVARYVALQEAGELRGDLPFDTLLRFLGVILDGLVTQQGAGFPIDVEGTLALVRTALSPK